MRTSGPTATMASPPRHVAVTGATGLIGSALVADLRARGVRVRRLVRRPPEGPDDIRWDPAAGVLDPRALEGVEAVVNLAGENIGQRWTSRRRRAILESRVQATELLAKVICDMERRPRVLASGSAIGIYGDRGDELLDETSGPGDDFLAGVARQWELAAAPARSAQTRVVLLRTGLVLTKRGGALARMLPLFRAGAGGPLASGRQWLSWIALDDEVAAIRHVLAHPTLDGPVNLAAPAPVTNKELTKALSRVLHRPAMLPVPKLALELTFGEMARVALLASQRAVPARLTESGFTFGYGTVESALQHELSHGPGEES